MDFRCTRIATRVSVSRRDFLIGILAGVAATASVGCGTILYPERRGQPAGRLDWGVVALDAIGLIFFFIPGVIAFAVDFSTGAIYLPPGYYGAARAPNSRRLEAVKLGNEQLTPDLVESVVSAHVERPVRLARGEFFSQPMQSLDEFWSLEAACDV